MFVLLIGFELYSKLISCGLVGRLLAFGFFFQPSSLPLLRLVLLIFIIISTAIDTMFCLDEGVKHLY